MKVLVINCGSSSLKYQLIDSVSEDALAVGICERIGIDGKLTQKVKGEKTILQNELPDHEVAIANVIAALTNPEYGVIKSLDEINAVGHRVVHGGEKFSSSVIITKEILAEIEDCNELAPLHNPANVTGIKACMNLMPSIPMVAVFDTAFHQTMPKEAYLYGIPYDLYERYKIRRYGFHGTSHSFVSKRAIEYANLDPNNSKVIVCHLGNGASITAVKNGKSIDTSMGLTPLEGLIMGTRCGDIDPAIIEFIAKKEGITLEETMDILNKKSGVLGISGVSSDFRDLEDAYNAGHVRAMEAFTVFTYRVAKYIGSYITAMNGIDAIAFTAGLGENDQNVRAAVCEHLGFLGVTIDMEKNNTRGTELMLSNPDSRVKVMIIPTNEELAICRETVTLIK